MAPATKLAPEMQQAIVAAYADGVPMREIGRQFRISDCRVRTVLASNGVALRPGQVPSSHEADLARREQTLREIARYDAARRRALRQHPRS